MTELSTPTVRPSSAACSYCNLSFFMSYPFILTLRVRRWLAAYHRWQCVGVILFQNTVTQRRGNTAINALSKTARWRRCLQASRNTSHYIRSIHFWEHFHKPTRPSRLCLSGAEKQARNTFCIFLYLFVRRLQAWKYQETSCSPGPIGVKPTHVWCSKVLQTGIESHMRISDSASDVLGFCKNGKDKVSSNLCHYALQFSCEPCFTAIPRHPCGVMTQFVGNCLINPGPDLTTLSSSVCGWSESLELLQIFRHRTLTSNAACPGQSLR